MVGQEGSVIGEGEMSMFSQRGSGRGWSRKIELVGQLEEIIVIQVEVNVIGEGEVSVVGQGEVGMAGLGEMSVVGQLEMSMVGQRETSVIGQGEESVVGQSEVIMLGGGVEENNVKQINEVTKTKQNNAKQTKAK